MSERLDVALAARPEVGSRAKAARLIEAGLVTVDGVLRPKSFLVQPGILSHSRGLMDSLL